LYKTCLKLHRGLPLHIKAIGDTYVKDEFRSASLDSPITCLKLDSILDIELHNFKSIKNDLK
jgi:hypothetical protein